MSREYRLEEIAKHNQQGDCWVVFHGDVYDLTDFLLEHPVRLLDAFFKHNEWWEDHNYEKGGTAVLLRVAGKDGTNDFQAIHPKDVLKQLPANAYKGRLKQSGSKNLSFFPIFILFWETVTTISFYSNKLKNPLDFIYI